MKKEYAIGILLLILCGVATWKQDNFLSATNMMNQASQVGMFGILAIGAAFVIITGGIDLSVGSMLALQGATLSILLVDHKWPWWIATAAVLAGTMALGLIHAMLIVKARIQPFIVTLCGLLIYRGLTRYIAGDSTKGFYNDNYGPLRLLASGKLAWLNGHPAITLLTNVNDRPVVGIPMPFIVLCIAAVLMSIVLRKSVYGRYLYAVGRNEDAARYSGVATKVVIGSAYVVSGLMVGLSGLLFAFYTNSISPATYGNSYELFAIAPAVLGGCNLRGGEGSVSGVILGTALICVLRNLVNLFEIPSSLEFAVIGGVMLIGVLADQIVASQKQRRTSSQQN